MAKAKRPNPEKLVAAVRPEGKKKAKWYVKEGNNFRLANFAEARTVLRDAGYETAETNDALNTIRSNPYTAVRESKSGKLSFVN